MTSFIGWPPTWATLLLLPALFMGFTVHELAHAAVAYALGDTSQVEQRRLTFNPLRHVSWVGMAAFLLFGFGWARPVWVDYTRLRIKNRPLGMFLVAVSGSASNLLFALLALGGIIATMMIVEFSGVAGWTDALAFLTTPAAELDLQGLAIALSSQVFMVNLILALFNMLPIPPLDGFAAVVSLFTLMRNVVRREQPAQAVRPWSAAPPVPGAAESPARIHFSIGLNYQRDCQYDEAIARYRQAIDHDPQFGLAYYNLGLAYVARGRLSVAAGAFRSAVQHSVDAGVRAQAELRLRELGHVDQHPGVPPGLLSPPLDLDTVIDAPSSGPPPLDPMVARHVWIRLGVGGAAFAILSLLVWLFVTGVTLIQLGSG